MDHHRVKTKIKIKGTTNYCDLLKSTRLIGKLIEN